MYYLYNGHGDVTALADTAGTIQASYYYDAFGNATSTSGTFSNNYKYAGYAFDAESGLYYCNARYYDAKLARFISEDSYLGDKADPLSLNLYTYCAGNPIRYTDPTGHDSKGGFGYFDENYIYHEFNSCGQPIDGWGHYIPDAPWIQDVMQDEYIFGLFMDFLDNNQSYQWTGAGVKNVQSGFDTLEKNGFSNEITGDDPTPMTNGGSGTKPTATNPTPKIYVMVKYIAEKNGGKFKISADGKTLYVTIKGKTVYYIIGKDTKTVKSVDANGKPIDIIVIDKNKLIKSFGLSEKQATHQPITDQFDSQNDAALAFSLMYSGASKKAGKEWGAWIYQKTTTVKGKEKTTYYYGDVVKSTSGVSLDIWSGIDWSNRENVVASIHTHGSAHGQYDMDFSDMTKRGPGDVPFTIAISDPKYLGHNVSDYLVNYDGTLTRLDITEDQYNAIKNHGKIFTDKRYVSVVATGIPNK